MQNNRNQGYPPASTNGQWQQQGYPAAQPQGGQYAGYDNYNQGQYAQQQGGGYPPAQQHSQYPPSAQSAQYPQTQPAQGYSNQGYPAQASGGYPSQAPAQTAQPQPSYGYDSKAPPSGYAQGGYPSGQGGMQQMTSQMGQMNMGGGGAAAPAQGGGRYPGAAPTGAGGGGAYPTPNAQTQPPPPTAVPEYVHVCDPKQIALTAGVLPSQSSTAQRAHVPLGIVIQPLAETESECPVVNFGAVGVVRCKHCRAYMNPYVTWMDGGAHWRCNLCGLMNETPSGYYAALDETGRRTDLAKRAELIHSTVEIVATPHYMIRAPMPCVYFFVFDVSRPSIASGALARACSAAAASLDHLPGGKRTMIGFLSYDSRVHFYALKAGSPPKMTVQSDLEDIFLPEPHGLLVNLAEARECVDSLLELLPSMHQHTTDVEAALGPALEAAHEIMKPIGGKLSVFSSTLPSIGCGRLMNRDDPAKLGKPGEHKLLLSAAEYYKELAFRMSHVQISVDVYLFSRYYTDVATLNDLAKFTGGQTHRFPAYYDTKDGEDLYRLVTHSLTREQGWESVIRVRVGKGYKVTDFFGNFRLRSTDLLTVPCIDSNKAFALQMAVVEKGVESQCLSVQSALLYTTSFGERRIRVHTVCVPVTSFTSHIYTSINSPVVTALLFKQAIARVTSASFDKAREHVRKSVTSLLRSYSYTSGAYSTSQALELPDNLAALPLQCLGMLKHEALRDRNVLSDKRAAVHAYLYPMGLNEVEIAVRPRLLPIESLDGKSMPQELELTAASIDPSQCLVLDDGKSFMILVGNRVDPKWVNTVFEAMDAKSMRLRDLEENSPTELQLVYQVLDSIRTPFHKGTYVIADGTQDAAHFYGALVQDRTMGEQSLDEYMQFILRR
uniref:Uncharacterized protein n=1 Tax=Lotharella globosa TaxID=91324 RepID=A0A7S4DPI2_9EUKA